MKPETLNERSQERATCFIIPEPTSVVESVIEVKAVTNVTELGLIKAGVAVYFTELRLLKMIGDYQDLFPDFDFVVLVGYPESTYSESFNQLVWSFEQVSFDGLLAELSAQKRIDAIRAEQPKRRQDGSRVPNEAKPKPFTDMDRFDGRGSADDGGGDGDA